MLGLEGESLVRVAPLGRWHFGNLIDSKHLSPVIISMPLPTSYLPPPAFPAKASSPSWSHSSQGHEEIHSTSPWSLGTSRSFHLIFTFNNLPICVMLPTIWHCFRKGWGLFWSPYRRLGSQRYVRALALAPVTCLYVSSPADLENIFSQIRVGYLWPVPCKKKLYFCFAAGCRPQKLPKEGHGEAIRLLQDRNQEQSWIRVCPVPQLVHQHLSSRTKARLPGKLQRPPRYNWLHHGSPLSLRKAIPRGSTWAEEPRRLAEGDWKSWYMVAAWISLLSNRCPAVFPRLVLRRSPCPPVRRNSPLLSKSMHRPHPLSQPSLTPSPHSKPAWWKPWHTRVTGSPLSLAPSFWWSITELFIYLIVGWSI